MVWEWEQRKAWQVAVFRGILMEMQTNRAADKRGLRVEASEHTTE